MSGSTISPTASKRKMFLAQFSIALTPLERMFLEYYAERYGKDLVEVIRGMLHKYVQIDRNFNRPRFLKWAEKSYIPREEDKDRKALLRKQLAEYEATATEVASRAPAKRAAGKK